MKDNKILSEYMAADPGVKENVKSLLTGESHIFADITGEGKERNVSVGWKADQSLSIVLIMGLIRVGNKEFGETWLRALQTELNSL